MTRIGHLGLWIAVPLLAAGCAPAEKIRLSPDTVQVNRYIDGGGKTGIAGRVLVRCDPRI